jgi:hypothetical protein
MSNLKNQKIPALIVSVVAIIMIASSYLDFEVLDVTAGYIKSWNSMLFSFTLLAGSVNLLQVSSKKIQRKMEGEWIPNIVLLVTMFSVIGVWIFTSGITSPLYQWLYTNVLNPLESSLYALVGFFLVYAAWIGFRARNFESGIMLVSGILIMLAMTSLPLGGLFDLGNWLKDVPGTAGSRSFMITAAIGTMMMGLRIILGRQKVA